MQEIRVAGAYFTKRCLDSFTSLCHSTEPYAAAHNKKLLWIEYCSSLDMDAVTTLRYSYPSGAGATHTGMKICQTLFWCWARGHPSLLQVPAEQCLFWLFEHICISFSGTCWLVSSRHSLECCVKSFLSAASWQNKHKIAKVQFWYPCSRHL